MSYELFIRKVSALCRRSGIFATFDHDLDKGLYMASLSTGGVITGNSTTASVTYRDRNHCYMAAI